MSSRLMRQGLELGIEIGKTPDRRLYPICMATFDQEIHKKITEFIERHEQDPRGRKVAVFDADGTLWRGDIGEEFFQFQIEKKWNKPNCTWEKYWNEVKSGDKLKAYGWLAQWNAGMLEDDLREQIQVFLRERFNHAVFEPMRTLTHSLVNAGFEIWVVSASPIWNVQEATRGFGIQQDHIIGVSAIVAEGVLTEQLVTPLPYRDGKAKQIASRIGVAPLFAAGNTYWDKEMLETATEMALCISSEGIDGHNYDSESKLKALATEKNSSGSKTLWLAQRF